MCFYKWRPERKENSYIYIFNGYDFSKSICLIFQVLPMPNNMYLEIAEQDVGAFYDDVIAQSHLGLNAMALTRPSPGVLTEPLDHYCTGTPNSITPKLNYHSHALSCAAFLSTILFAQT